MGEKSINNVRDSGVELLRILATLSVIILHIRGGWETAVLPNTVNYYVYWIIEILCAAAVNCFLLITGYYSAGKNSFSLWKPLELYLQLVICREIVYITMVITGIRQFTMYEAYIKLFPTNYYVTLYIGMILLAPYINRLISVLDDASLKKMIVVLVILLSVWPTIVDLLEDLANMDLAGANSISSEGGAFGQTLIHFIFVFILGSALKRFNVQKKPGICILTVVVSNIVLTILCFVYLHYGIKVNRIITYSNPLLILEAIGLFMLFKGMSFQSKAINILASASFMTYILHGYFLSLVSIENIVNDNVLFVIARTCVMLVGVYLVCFVCEMIYKVTVRRSIKKVQSHL